MSESCDNKITPVLLDKILELSGWTRQKTAPLLAPMIGEWSWVHPSYANLTGQAPNFAVDANAALLLCDEMRQRNLDVEITNGPDNSWVCEFFKRETVWYDPGKLDEPRRRTPGVSFIGCGVRLSEAICMAYLVSHNAWPDTPEHASLQEMPDPVKLPAVWEYSSYRATLRKNGEFFAFVSSDGMQSISPGKTEEMLAALNHGRIKA